MVKTELYHEIFGSILDRTEMTPYLLRPALGYKTGLRRATRMLGNRGFDTLRQDELRASEKARALAYIAQVRRYSNEWLFPFVSKQLQDLADLRTAQEPLYRDALASVGELEKVLLDQDFLALVEEDPRHLFMLASLRKYPHLFRGHPRAPRKGQSAPWQKMACSILKMAHLIKSLEEDSQEIHQYAQLGLHLETKRQNLGDLFHFDFTNAEIVPKDDASRIAFVKLSTFFYKLRESLRFDASKQCHVFHSGDGVEVDIVDVKARLKSPESMLSKLGKDVEGEAYDIRDILAITFLLKSRHDTLTLFHALQKRGVILQENTVSHSITQTLFADPDDMIEAVRRLMHALAHSEGHRARPSRAQLQTNAGQFFEALGRNQLRNVHSSGQHRKFQCKINFSLPIHRQARSHEILIPGTSAFAHRERYRLVTEQHTLPVELRISDEQSWKESEQTGDAHHDAYKFRQLLALMNRMFRPTFHFPSAAQPRLRRDQRRLFPAD
jgi:uncharacterized protein (TIGR04562 family)